MPRLPALLLVLWPMSAWAAEPPDMTAALLRTGWAMLVVVGLILALYGLSKKRLLPRANSGTAIRIVEMRPLQPKTTLALVEVRGREYLLGIGADSVRLLADLSADPVKKPADAATTLTPQP